MTCECKLCKRHHEFEALIADMAEPAKTFFTKLYDDLNNVEFEHDWLKMKIEQLEHRDD